MSDQGEGAGEGAVRSSIDIGGYPPDRLAIERGE